MSQIETVIADISNVAKGAWEKKPYFWGPEETVRNRFTAAIKGYVDAYIEACRILDITRGDNFTELPVDKRRKIVLGLSRECAEDRNEFVTHFEKDVLTALYNEFLTGDCTRWGRYVTARRAADNWLVFTDIPQTLKVELPQHGECKPWKPENTVFQTRFARQLGILGPEQEFGDLEEDQRVVRITGGTQDLDPEFSYNL